MTTTIYSFDSDANPQLSEVGGKALSLIESTRAGLPVPEGIALAVEFFSPWTDQVKSTGEWRSLIENPTRENCDVVKAIASALNLTGEQHTQLDTATSETLPSADQVAVRSSSPEEDLVGSSFAGMYETFLGTPLDQLEGTIAKAYASMFDFRVMEYKAQNNINLEGTCISVVVQKQIASDVSGIGFSLNPMNNCFDEAVINSSFGLGEAIVSGIVTPDSFIVEKTTMEILDKNIQEKAIALHLGAHGGVEKHDNTEPNAPSLTDAQVLELTALISTCEQHYGLPVDIEWAYHDNSLYLLQARPITSYVPLYPEMLTSPGERKKLYMDVMPLTQGFGDPLTVLGADVWGIVIDRFKQGGFPAGPDGHLLNLHGRQYFQVHNLFKGYGKKLGLAIPASTSNAFEGREEEIYAEYVAAKSSELVKRGRNAQVLGAVKMLPNIIGAMLNPAKAAEKFDRTVEQTIRTFKAFDHTMPFDELVESAFVVFEEIILQMAVGVSGLLASRKVTKMFAGTEVEDLTDSVLMDLASNPTSAMGHAMFELACFDQFKSTLTTEEFERRIGDRSYSEAFLTAFDDYLYRYGERGFKEIDVASKRTDETLDEFFVQLKAINVDDNQMLKVRGRKEDALVKMRAVASANGKLKSFNKAVEAINLTYGYRETPKYLVVIMNGNLRKAALQLADEFVAAGRLADREQIFDLHKEQIGAAQKDASLQLLPLIEENLKPRALMANVKNFPSFIDSRGKIIHKAIDAEDGDLDGQPVSNGVITGKAKVLASPYEKPLEPGEILVTVATEPAWTPIFVNAAGVVLEVGGGLQHGAIIAREYGIPCVSGLPGVTEIIKDGDLLEVDGTNGIVRIIETA